MHFGEQKVDAHKTTPRGFGKGGLGERGVSPQVFGEIWRVLASFGEFGRVSAAPKCPHGTWEHEAISHSGRFWRNLANSGGFGKF